MYTPTRYKIVCGIGHSKYSLASFDAALVNAGIADYNLVKVSSILPPACSCVTDELLPPPGAILFTAYASITSNVLEESISSAISVGLPKSIYDIGVIMENSTIGTTNECVKIVEAMAADAMERRKIPLLQVITQSVETQVVSNEYYTTFAGVIMW